MGHRGPKLKNDVGSFDGGGNGFLAFLVPELAFPVSRRFGLLRELVTTGFGDGGGTQC